MSEMLYKVFELVMDTDFARVVCYPEQKLIHHTVNRALSSPELRAVLNAGASALQQFGAIKWLSDDSHVGELLPADLAWGNTDWFPRAAAAGWKYWALVVPEDVKARYSLTEAVDGIYQGGVRIMVFTYLNVAKEWLERF